MPISISQLEFFHSIKKATYAIPPPYTKSSLLIAFTVLLAFYDKVKDLAPGSISEGHSRAD